MPTRRTSTTVKKTTIQFSGKGQYGTSPKVVVNSPDSQKIIDDYKSRGYDVSYSYTGNKIPNLSARIGRTSGVVGQPVEGSTTVEGYYDGVTPPDTGYVTDTLMKPKTSNVDITYRGGQKVSTPKRVSIYQRSEGGKVVATEVLSSSATTQSPEFKEAVSRQDEYRQQTLRSQSAKRRYESFKQSQQDVITSQQQLEQAQQGKDLKNLTPEQYKEILPYYENYRQKYTRYEQQSKKVPMTEVPAIQSTTGRKEYYLDEGFAKDLNFVPSGDITRKQVVSGSSVGMYLSPSVGNITDTKTLTTDKTLDLTPQVQPPERIMMLNERYLTPEESKLFNASGVMSEWKPVEGKRYDPFKNANIQTQYYKERYEAEIFFRDTLKISSPTTRGILVSGATATGGLAFGVGLFGYGLFKTGQQIVTTPEGLQKTLEAQSQFFQNPLEEGVMKPYRQYGLFPTIGIIGSGVVFSGLTSYGFSKVKNNLFPPQPSTAPTVNRAYFKDYVSKQQNARDFLSKNILSSKATGSQVAVFELKYPKGAKVPSNAPEYVQVEAYFKRKQFSSKTNLDVYQSGTVSGEIWGGRREYFSVNGKTFETNVYSKMGDFKNLDFRASTNIPKDVLKSFTTSPDYTNFLTSLKGNINYKTGNTAPINIEGLTAVGKFQPIGIKAGDISYFQSKTLSFTYPKVEGIKSFNMPSLIEAKNPYKPITFYEGLKRNIDFGTTQPSGVLSRGTTRVNVFDFGTEQIKFQVMNTPQQTIYSAKGWNNIFYKPLKYTYPEGVIVTDITTAGRGFSAIEPTKGMVFFQEPKVSSVTFLKFMPKGKRGQIPLLENPMTQNVIIPEKQVPYRDYTNVELGKGLTTEIGFTSASSQKYPVYKTTPIPVGYTINQPSMKQRNNLFITTVPESQFKIREDIIPQMDFNIKQRNLIKPVDITMQKVSQAQMQKQIQYQIAPQKQQQPDFNVPDVPIFPPVVPPDTPPPFIVFPDFKFKQKSFGKGLRFKQSFKYTPSFTAFAFNIKKPKKFKTSKAFSPFDFRGI